MGAREGGLFIVGILLTSPAVLVRLNPPDNKNNELSGTETSSLDMFFLPDL